VPPFAQPVSPHRPPAQRCVPLHATPQAPQLPTSLVVSTHAPAQAV
jgi:hypothetical protein